jgi:hypothetical protein
MWEQGIIMTDAGEVIGSPAMTLDKLLASGVKVRDRIEPTGPGHHRVGLGPMLIDGLECVGSAYFHDRQTLLSITLSLDATRQMLGTDRAPAAEELRLYQAWVEKQTGRASPARFAWGEIGASADHWTGEPSIYVRYI